MTFLDKLLQGLPEDVKNHVQRVVINYELDPNNPEILLAVLCGHIESLAGKIPAKIAAQIEESARKAGAIAERNIEQRECEIQARLVEFVVQNSEQVLRARTHASRLQWFCMACCFSVILAAGCLYGGYKWGFGVRDADYRVEIERLPQIAAWAAADEGKQARRFSNLNGGFANLLSCFSKGSTEWRGNLKYCFPKDSTGAVYGWIIDQR